mmetsp:Transcript_82862/g.162453  ORF Transcript_82862/g.162453 Transcript_82862/m.162453 type:complete len:198 (+) Transcript_82862:35-628(+)
MLVSPFLTFCVLNTLFVLIYSLDHAARLDEMIAKKNNEAKLANKHVDHIVHSAKIRAETVSSRNIASKPLSNENAKNAHDRHMMSMPEVEPTIPRQESRSKMHSTLSAHGVSHALFKEINNMAASYIPREAIVKHVQTHFPNKEPHEWNDIVISAIAAAGKVQPGESDTSKATRNEASLQKKKFEHAMDSLQGRMDR